MENENENFEIAEANLIEAIRQIPETEIGIFKTAFAAYQNEGGEFEDLAPSAIAAIETLIFDTVPKIKTKREIAKLSRAQRKFLIPRRAALFDIEIAFEEIAEAIPLEAFNKLLNVFDEYGRVCAEEGAEEFGSEEAQILAQTLSDIFAFEQGIEG